jgi:hypothetical protein
MYSTFIQNLQSLGCNDVERAKALDVSTKTIERYRASDLPESILKLLRAPQLLRALADDADKILAQSDINVEIAS